MGFIKAFNGALGGSFADQWKDYLTLPDGLSGTIGVCKATRSSNNQRRSSNIKASDCIITDGSTIVVPEGFSLVTLENGGVTGFVSEPGGYIWKADNPNSRSVFSENTLSDSVLKQTWERFSYGGAPGISQIAVYINQKEIPNNRFGTQSPIYWDDAYLNAQVGATVRGTYTLRIVNPIQFLRAFVPAEYYSFNADVTAFDFGDFDNVAATQLFTEVVGSLAAAFSTYSNAGGKLNRIASLQGDTIGFTKSLSSVLEGNYGWESNRGIAIVNATIIAIDYDQASRELLTQVQRADALMGARGNSNLQASFAAGLESAGNNPDGGALGMGFMGMAAGSVGGAFESMRQPVSYERSVVGGSNSQEAVKEDPYEKLAHLKELLDKGVISQEEFDAVKKKTLDL